MTSPRLTAAGRTDALEQSVALLDPSGRPTHRTGFAMGTVGLTLAGSAAVGSSLARAHWFTETSGYLDDGPGAAGESVDAAALWTASVVRGPWEIRLVRVEELPGHPLPAAGVTLRLGGWAVSGDEPTDAWSTPTDVRAGASVGGVRSLMFGVSGFDAAGVRLERDVSPLGGTTLTPWLTAPVTLQTWFVAILCLGRPSGGGSVRAIPPVPRVDFPTDALQVRVRWGDEVESTVELADPLTGGHHPSDG